MQLMQLMQTETDQVSVTVTAVQVALLCSAHLPGEARMVMHKLESAR